MRFPIVTLLLLLVAPLAARAGEACQNPWVVVLQKDGTTVEGYLVKDTDKGVLVEVAGRTRLVPEAQIEEVVEDCGRARGTVAAPAAPASKLRRSEADFRNGFVDTLQMGMRWVGGACMSLGCGVCISGSVAVLVGLVGALTSPGGGTNLQLTLIGSGLALAILGLISGTIAGTGFGLMMGARFTDFLRPDNSRPLDEPVVQPVPVPRLGEADASPPSTLVAGRGSSDQAF